MTDISRACKIDGCGKPHYGRGWCIAHWTRWWRHGDPLKGRNGFGQAKLFYENVVLTYDGADCLIWPFSKNEHGYGRMGGSGGGIVSRILCTHEYGSPPTDKHEAAHSCGRGQFACVTKRHVSWKTRKENASDMVAHGTLLFGENSPSARLKVSEVREIQALKGRVSQREVAGIFKISQQHVSNIQNGNRWRRL